MTVGAVSSSPRLEDDARSPRRPSCVIRATGGVGADLRAEGPRRRRRAPRSRRPCRRAGSPTHPIWPSPTSPILWCAITYAVPAERGPGPRADHAADREHALHRRRTRSTRRRRSAMLIVNSRVDVDRLPRVEAAQLAQQQRLVRARSRRLAASRPWAGSSSSSGPSTSPSSSSHASQTFDRVGVLGGELRDLLVPARAGRAGSCRYWPSRRGREVGALRDRRGSRAGRARGRGRAWAAAGSRRTTAT